MLWFLTAIQLGWLGTSRGDTPAPGASAAATVAAPLTVLSAAPTCDACEPQDTAIDLVFSAPVDAIDVSNALAVEPYVALVPDAPGVRRRVRLKGVLTAQTRYELTLPAGFCAPGGGCTGAPSSIAFRTGGGVPVLEMPTRNTVLPPGGEVPLRVENVEQPQLRVIDVGEGEVAAAMAVVGRHYPPEDPFLRLPAAMQRRARQLAVAAAAAPEAGGQRVDPFHGKSSGLALVLLSARGAGARVGLFQRGTLGVHLKLGSTSGVAWVTETSSGKPVAGAAVTVLSERGAAWRGTTGADGLLTLPSRSRLAGVGNEGRLYAYVRSGTSTAVTASDFTDGVEKWAFDLPYYYYSGQEALRGVVTTERGIYRPGETAHVLAVLRKRLADGRLAPPLGSVELTLRDPDGGEVARRTVHLTAYGTARADLLLPRVGAVGRYTLALTKDGVTLHHDFEVGEFRAATFEVELPQVGDADTEGDELVIPIAARYLYGAPVAAGKATYDVSWRHRRVTFPGYETYGFTGDQEYYYSYPQHLTGGEAALDPHGRAVVRLPRSLLPDADDDAQALDLVIEATVTDAADDAISARTVQRVDRTETFVGVRSERWVVAPRDGWDLRLVALDRRGRPRPSQALEVELERTFWNTVAEVGPHGTRYRSSRETSIVATRSVTSTSDPVSLHFDLPGGGEYVARVRPKNGPGAASASVWAWGDGAGGAVENDPRLELRLDRDAYAPGDTARLHATVPYPRATGLLTVERDGVLSARVVELGSASGPLEIAVAARYLPNAFVGLVAVPRDAAALPATGSPLRAGYVELSVDPGSRRLEVELTPESTSLEPGASARVRVRVRDQAGKPARAEVTVWAADEGVLMLTGYRTPDPFQPAYAPYELDVTTATNLVRMTSYDPDSWLDGGGDGGGLGTALRSRFLATAFFSPGVTTDARGEATVSFTLPDNVTRWRILGVAADGGERFGNGESSIQASKALQVTPSLPRFATEGDLVDAGVVVHNQTGAAGRFTVRLTASGAAVLGGSSQDLELAAGAAEQVRFPLTVGGQGELGITAEVTGAGKRDAFTLSLPIHAPAPPEHEVVGEGALSQRTSLDLVVPAGARVGTASLDIVISSSILASLARGVESLIDYPHGCAEQKTSRLIPMITLGELISGLGIPGFEPRTHRARLEDTIAALEQHQNDDGGFGLWVESETDPFVTAYVLYGWLVAKEHGYTVSERRLARGVAFLKEAVSSGAPVAGYFGPRADPFAAYVLARAGADDAGLLERLAAARGELSRADQALVAASLAYRAKRGPASPALAAVFADLLTARQGDPARALIHERDSVTTYLGNDDLEATALAAHALVVAGRIPEAEALVRGVLQVRQADGTWGTTYDNLLAVQAVGDVVRASPAAARSGAVALAIDGKVVGELKLEGAASIGRVSVPAAALPSPGSRAELTLVPPRGSRFEYVASLRYLPAGATLAARDRGYEIEREVVDAVTGEQVTRPVVGQLLRVRLTVKGGAGRRQVAVTDRLPAGLEAVNAALATEQQRTSAEGAWEWSSREVRDERVSFFAHELYGSASTAEYLARASRSGEFSWPAATVESMYVRGQDARTGIEPWVVTR